jgi:hypothetical protein
VIIKSYQHVILPLAGTREVKRDFIRENTKQIKTIQKSSRESISSAREPVNVLQKSDKYEHIESKVAQEVKVG